MNDPAGQPAGTWLDEVFDRLQNDGLAIVPAVVSTEDRARTREGLARAAAALQEDLPNAGARARARRDTELRLLMRYDPHFFRFLEYPQALAIIDRFLAPTAILRFQNGTIVRRGFEPNAWHMNGRRVLNGYRAALEIAFAIDDLEGHEFLFALGTHRRLDTPAQAELEALAQPVTVPAGAMLVFDSTLWHRQGNVDDDRERRLVTHQFARHFIKPHIDYVRALGDAVVAALPERTRRLIGWESRVPASAAEFYVAPEERGYATGQE